MNSLKVFFLALKAQLLDIWDRGKIFFFSILGLIVFFEWQKVKEFLLTYMSQKEIQADKKEDQQLASKEKTENDQVNVLEQKASNEITDDSWYQK